MKRIRTKDVLEAPQIYALPVSLATKVLNAYGKELERRIATIRNATKAPARTKNYSAYLTEYTKQRALRSLESRLALISGSVGINGRTSIYTPKDYSNERDLRKALVVAANALQDERSQVTTLRKMLTETRNILKGTLRDKYIKGRITNRQADIIEELLLEADVLLISYQEIEEYLSFEDDGGRVNADDFIEILKHAIDMKKREQLSAQYTATEQYFDPGEIF